jgi:hypothetical protein
MLFNGTIDGHQILFRLAIPDNPLSIGTWKTYVIVFDTVYIDRWGKPLGCRVLQYPNYCADPPDFQNAVTFSVITIDVTPRQSHEQSPMIYVPLSIQTIVILVLSYISYLKEADFIETIFKKIAEKTRQHWLIIFVLLVFMLYFIIR